MNNNSNNSLSNNEDFDIDLIDFNLDNELFSSNNQNDIKLDVFNDEIVDLRDSNKNSYNLNNNLIKENYNNVALDSKSTFDIGNLSTNNYNIKNINTKETSEDNKYNYKFDSSGNKKSFSEIKYKNNLNITDENQGEELSNNNLLNGFYDLEIEDYPNRTNLIYSDNTNNKSLGLDSKNNFISEFLNKIFNIKRRK